MYQVVWDAETTGRSPLYHDVISCGVVVISNKKIVDKFYGTCQPVNPKSFNIDTTKVHGFTLDDCMKFKAPRSMAIDLLWFLKPYLHDNYNDFIYHALNGFDYKFIENYFRKVELEYSFWKMFNWQKRTSTIDLARELGYEDNKLSSWALRMNEEHEHHNSLSDAMATAKLYLRLIEEKKI